jgi:G3E family GTPase
MKKTKLDIISGFLGAGKTTFIKKLMQDIYKDEKVVILENEFGRINIDQETLGREGLTVKPIQAGCICCSSSMELQKGIFEILKEFKPDCIILEPTGLAKLSEVKKLLQYEDMTEICEIEHVVTIVDTKNYYIRTMISKEFFEDQLRASEVIFLSKTDGMKEENILKVISEIVKIQPNCQIISTPWDNIKADRLQELMDKKREVPARKGGPHLRINHVNDFESYEIIRENPIDLLKVKEFIKDLNAGIYGEVHRLKGIIKDAESGLYTVESVPGETKITPQNFGEDFSSQSKLCLIGRNLKTSKLEDIFQ